MVFLYALLWIATRDPVGAFLSLLVLVLGAALLMAVLVYLIANAPAWSRALGGVSREEHLKQLQARGEALLLDYEVIAALTVEDLGTSCLIHFLDIGESRILCLYGQEYYEFEPIEDDPEFNQPRRFPTRTFSLLLHRKKNKVLNVYPGDAVLEPAVCDPIKTPDNLNALGFKLKDGEVVTGTNLAAIEKVLNAST